MTEESWDQIAEAAKWSKKNSQILVDAHWIGGNPGKMDVYGWASWSPKGAVLGLRNPDDKSKSITIDIEKVFELPVNAPKEYKLESPYKDQRIQSLKLSAGKKATIELRPFEVLVFDSTAD